MSRFVRNSAILAKVETTYGTDASPTGAADAILVSNLNINPLSANNVPRDLLRPYFGGSEQLVGSAHVELSFDVEFQNGGTAGTLAKWDGLLQACGFLTGAPLTTPARVEHLFATDYSALKSNTIYYHDDGLLKKLLGARGTMSMNLRVGDRPVFSFKFIGLDGGETATANPSTTLTGFKTPMVITDTNTGALTLGCTYVTGALSGGTEYVGSGMQIDLGNSVEFTDLLGTATATGQTVNLMQREMVGSIELDLTAAQEVTFMTNVKANATQSIGLVHGTTAGYKMLVFMPTVQFINPKKIDKNGRRLIGFDMRILPSSGNDEFRLVAL